MLRRCDCGFAAWSRGRVIRCPAEGLSDVMALDTGPTGLLLEKVHGIVPLAMSPLSLPMKHEWGK